MTLASAAHGFWEDVNLDCFLSAVWLWHGSNADEGARLDVTERRFDDGPDRCVVSKPYL
jgi:hypothetical protein